MLKKPFIFGGIALIIALVAGGWFWRESVKEKQAQVERKQSEITLNADEVWYPIPELGIKMKLNREFAQDLMYSYDSTLTFITEKDFPGDSYPEYEFEIARQHYGRVNLSFKSLFGALKTQKRGKCLESARGALGVIEKLPKHSDGNFYPSFIFSSDGDNNFDEHQNELISKDEGIYGTSYAIYKKLDENNLIVWYIYPDVTECFNPKDHSPYTVDGTSTIMEYEIAVPNYQGLGSKTITDGFKDIQPL